MEKVKEFISYGIVGVMTTLVNYIIYFRLNRSIGDLLI